MSELDEGEVYAAIGEEGFARLVHAFYAHVPSDPILGAMYPKHDLAGAEQRLRDFLVGRFGGPPRYIEQRGHPRLRMRHMPFKLDEAARDRWVALMEHGARRGGAACGCDVAVAGVFCGDGDVSAEPVSQNARCKMPTGLYGATRTSHVGIVAFCILPSCSQSISMIPQLFLSSGVASTPA